ncbi:hypothetical protein [Capnocytophaga sp.]|uniref:hypothetical protein n=1 Tax=Capnocytophaga sp. TaxID=44737 RepID=UPI0026DD56F7|nr:hypothetical protein [Capnocytophaga sp.]MDO5106034.1 hypothetical protein [Capnocytophaga sp.]
MPFEQSNIQHQNQTEKDIANFEKLLDEVVKLAVLYLSFETISEGIFEFTKHKTLQKRINTLFDKFNKKAIETIDLYVDKHWAKSTHKSIFYKGKEVAHNSLKKELNAYKNRPSRLLSERVWNLSNNFRQDLELAIDVAISEGIPANRLASEIKKYLNEPDRLFRRYKDKNGALQLSKKAKAYHSGQGVYRSSYKNAERLARTEINMAYREADFQRWQTLDFITGYEIKRSKHPHPCKICDMMQGIYPKTFQWWGNHPNCRCYMVPIFKENMAHVPMNKNFIKWIKDNQQDIETAKSLPMFLWGGEQPTANTIIGKKEAIKNILNNALLSDPLQINTFIKLYDFMQVKVASKVREKAFKNMLKNESFKQVDDVFIMQGARLNTTELQTAQKLSRATNGYYVVFPSEGQIKGIKKLIGDVSKKKNDVYLYDKKTFYQKKADLKTLGDVSKETIERHLTDGSKQASVIVMDIQGQTNRHNIIKGLRAGWNKNIKEVLLNYKGKWYEIRKDKLFDDKWLKEHLK